MILIPKQALEKAIEAGFPRESLKMIESAASEYHQHAVMYELALNANFWRCFKTACNLPRQSEYYAHRFYDLVLEDIDTEPFWRELLGL